MVILGLDPGTATTGYGVIRVPKKNVFELVAYGTIETSKDKAQSDRLVLLQKSLAALLKKYGPDAVAVERLYFFKNLKTVMPVSEARGVILFTLASLKFRLFEFTPLQVKMALTGYGRADKKQMQKMAQMNLHLEKLPKPDDAADALCLAITCSLAMRGTYGT